MAAEALRRHIEKASKVFQGLSRLKWALKGEEKARKRLASSVAEAPDNPTAEFSGSWKASAASNGIERALNVRFWAVNVGKSAMKL